MVFNKTRRSWSIKNFSEYVQCFLVRAAIAKQIKKIAPRIHNFVIVVINFFGYDDGYILMHRIAFKAGSLSSAYEASYLH